MNEIDMINALIAAGHSGSLEEIKNKLEPKKHVAWKPELEEDYYFICTTGTVSCSQYDNDYIDKFRLGTGNCYRTEEDAKMALKIINRIIELRGGGTPDWDDLEKEKYTISYYPYSKRWEVCHQVDVEDLGSIYLPTKEAAQTLIDEFGDDLFLISGRI